MWYINFIVFIRLLEPEVMLNSDDEDNDNENKIKNPEEGENEDQN